MKFTKKYKILLWKRYFDLGFSFLGYSKYPLILLGIAIPNIPVIIAVSILYAILCFFFGWAFVHYGWYKAEQEVSNKFNLFVIEMRRKLSH